jgi:hypothetical protein
MAIPNESSRWVTVAVRGTPTHSGRPDQVRERHHPADDSPASCRHGQASHRKKAPPTTLQPSQPSTTSSTTTTTTSPPQTATRTIGCELSACPSQPGEDAWGDLKFGRPRRHTRTVVSSAKGFAPLRSGTGPARTPPVPGLSPGAGAGRYSSNSRFWSPVRSTMRRTAGDG